MGNKKRVIALGFFDGIHVGHQALFSKTVERAKELEAIPSVISFDTHPDTMVFGKKVDLINTSKDRVDIIKRIFDIDDTIFLHFDEYLMKMEWKDFIQWLVDWFHAVHFVAGYDFTFGYKGEGNIERLQERCKELGLGCDIIQKVEMDGFTVSSTLIRQLLKEGKMEEVNRYLGHPHTFTDTVRDGYKIGRTIGVPTINMRFAEGMVDMAHGVYAAKAYLEDGRVYTAVTNVGVKPTVRGNDTVSVESHLLDYSGYIYGKKVRLEFFSFIRPEVKFDSLAELQNQIADDVQKVRTYFENQENTEK